MDSVDAAEKEASEVLHSLLSVERIEKQDNDSQMQQVVVLNCAQTSDQGGNGEDIQWHTPVHQPLFSLDQTDNYLQQSNTVVWEGTLALDDESLNQQQTVLVQSEEPQQNIYSHQQTKPSTGHKNTNNNNNSVNENKKKNLKKCVRKRYKKIVKTVKKNGNEVKAGEGVEDDAQEVRARFQLGCECQDDRCFKGLNPENVYKHRLNIAELTKEEHDMYLMGVTMACMSDPGVTVKQRERRRLRAQYVYQGRRVCLSAFLYLENCTLYQLKRIRKHVMTHGVAPRVHGNHGKKPHNVFSLETYRRATEFLKSYIEKHNTGSGNCKNTVLFPAEVSRKTIHNAYIEFLKEIAPPNEKMMGYSTFRHFMKEQFPHLRFCKIELGNSNMSSSSSSNSTKSQQSHQQNQHQQHHQQQQQQQQLQHQHQQQQQHHQQQSQNSHTEDQQPQPPAVPRQTTAGVLLQTAPRQPSPIQTILSPSQMATIPVILSEPNKPELAPTQTAYIVTPVSQVVQAPYQAGHTITLTPIANTAYAFTTL